MDRKHHHASDHLLRINIDPSYSTFPTAAQIFEAGGQASPNSAPDGILPNAVWSDLDLACGQCHGGSGLFPVAATAPSFGKQRLAGDARCIRGKPVVHTSAGPNGSMSPAGTAFVTSSGNQTFTFSGDRRRQRQHQPGDELVPGSSQTYTFAPNAGYGVSAVTVDGVSQGAIASYAFTNIQANHVIAVTFAPNPPATIVATAGANGTMSPAPGTLNLLSGQSQSFAFTPNAGYRVSSVVVDGISRGAPTTYTFSNVSAGGHSLAVSFGPNAYTVTASAYGTGGGTVTESLDATVITAYGSATESVPAGGSVTYAFKPSAGYAVYAVTVDGSSKGAIGSYTFGNIATNHVLSVTFVKAP